MTTAKTAILFPGQGAQQTGMGRDVAEADKDVMDLWKKAESISGLPLREIYWDGDAQAMADTRNLQPALTVVNISLWMQVAGRMQPAAAAGHSLGEYAAVAASGALSAADTIELVSLRGRLMAEADPEGRGTMAAVLKLPLTDVESVVRETAEATGEMILIANYNTPAQFVLSGTAAAIADAAARVKERRGRAMPLAVSGAFHSPMMQQAADELARVMDKRHWNNMKFPVYCNATGLPVQNGDSLRSVMKGQMAGSVRWIETIGNQWNDGVRRWVELGPKNILGKMLQPILTQCGAADGEWSTSTASTREETGTL
ncbi:(Acyl-carrier-protein) S-malonyltransferase [Oleidesulfovibrio alaskensis G20]|jgi:[acyl-carrier-protein] S-malonyltransferase|uniref:Malonyl CoA-acyl carrier protein transacylase n=1 Tax=Oleidesulfovibrio alaskensis (strain ATCC BAA-1058 / DSM 17464 / G20) TaxID=207559 RepID=Q30Z05_OLEA2|nr:ACP S-malonyltransferase [Oleidesulfovibrio alaskensis]ABB39091.1 (Acyl-carrier-protein) S-malonyltransferase [Oleidesulfovibrio alaskensis G20]MBG0772139.1 ACP S-malonyltransferase [Oleidesulfovibrio alaskensis]MBL3583432.1 ACP S-malonyltransferase [Oleidesulfovibrio alaskensis]